MLLCTGFDLQHAILFPCHIFTQRPMTDHKFERTMGAALIGNNFSPIPLKISFHVRKKMTRSAPIFTKHLNLFDRRIESVSQDSESGSTFSSSEPVAARSDCRGLGNTLYLCSPVRPAQAVPLPQLEELAIDFAVKPFDYLLE